MELEAHLGGHQGKTHTDEGTLRWAIDKLGVQSMLDVGCGPGGMVELANSLGVDAYGVTAIIHLNVIMKANLLYTTLLKVQHQ